MKKIIRISLTLVILFLFAGISNAGYMPYNIGDITDFLNDSNYFNGYTELSSKDFSGEWQYTAIAFESGHINYISESIDGARTFTTKFPGNFGTDNTVNFDSANLFFSDGDPKNVPLDDFQKSQEYFRVFELTENSNPLTYLSNDPVFAVGTLIVGFNDNGVPQNGDSDFDDIVAAMVPAAAIHAPEPATILLLGFGLLGVAGWGKKKFKK